MIRLLLKQGADIGTETTVARSSLMEAAGFRCEGILQLMLERGLNIEMGNATLIWAIKGKREVTGRLLLGKGADINAKNEDGQTALMITAGSKALRAQSPAIWEVNWTRKDGYYSQGLLQLLLKKGADIHAADEDGETALMKAAVFGSKQEIYGDQEAIVQLLHERGADINARDKHEETALMKTAGSDMGANYEAQKAMVRLLLDLGADVYAQNTHGETALMKAAKCSRGNSEPVVQLLLEKGASIQAATKNGLTALMKAVRRGHKSMVRLLLEEGAEINAKDIHGETALMKAAEHGYEWGEAVVQLLLDRGANVEAADKNGKTALMRAQRKGHEGVMRLLTTDWSFHADEETDSRASTWNSCWMNPVRSMHACIHSYEDGFTFVPFSTLGDTIWATHQS